ncbi:hypothetical protein ACI65C_007034 [Semiaphis heraclei]
MGTQSENGLGPDLPRTTSEFREDRAAPAPTWWTIKTERVLKMMNRVRAVSTTELTTVAAVVEDKNPRNFDTLRPESGRRFDVQGSTGGGMYERVCIMTTAATFLRDVDSIAITDETG